MTQVPALVATDNERGYMHELSSVSRAFLEFCPLARGPVLDLGCAGGVATLPALRTGADVIGFDMDARHLTALEAATPPELRARLRLVHGAFPRDFPFAPDSLGAVLISQVLGFLTGEEIRVGFRSLHACMMPSAKLFIVNYTPFISITERYLPDYEAKRVRGHEWPGYVDDLRRYCARADLLQNLPNALNLMDPEVLGRELTRAGFLIERSQLLGGEQVPQKFRLDGREWVAVVATRT